MKRKEITLSIKQFMQIQKKEMNMTSMEIDIDDFINRINPKIKRWIIFGIACTMVAISSTKIAYADGSLPQIDTIGNKLLGIAQQVGYWLCLILCIKEILTEILQGNAITNPSDIAKPVVKYALAFASIYFMPSLFNWIKEVF